MTLEEVFDAFDAESRRIQDFVFELPGETLLKPVAFPMCMTGDPDAPLQASIAKMISMKCWHERHHLRQIQRFLGM